jgi:hypothetical protein
MKLPPKKQPVPSYELPARATLARGATTPPHPSHGIW